MATSKSLIGIGIGLAAVIIVAVFFYTPSSTNNSSVPLSVPPNATQATPLNTDTDNTYCPPLRGKGKRDDQGGGENMTSPPKKIA
ncbi:hypothetical protein DYY67_1426 [Candidatus Nitrosotalea sp. TS]|uniref:hypothetical protein n=1 Tax=Candidatus Nitrosotalea sp. TS TaxID=2341020 RepID=UPI00140C8437|nr:hypothetical protein [Candidatus Nitrosotalea sp. TS]NHI04051.1 hypothetical protein [Candidatus Nitrosotalea sp. TS]